MLHSIYWRQSHSERERERKSVAATTWAILSSYQQGFFYMHNHIDRVAHTTACGGSRFTLYHYLCGILPYVRRHINRKHWLEWEIAQWVHHQRSIPWPIAPWLNTYHGATSHSSVHSVVDCPINPSYRTHWAISLSKQFSTTGIT